MQLRVFCCFFHPIRVGVHLVWGLLMHMVPPHIPEFVSDPSDVGVHLVWGLLMHMVPPHIPEFVSDPPDVGVHLVYGIMKIKR